MPVFEIYCPSCDRTFQGFVLAGTKEPDKWVCSKCGEDKSLRLQQSASDHPLESTHGAGCPCCSGGTKA